MSFRRSYLEYLWRGRWSFTLISVGCRSDSQGTILASSARDAGAIYVASGAARPRVYLFEQFLVGNTNPVREIEGRVTEDVY